MVEVSREHIETVQGAGGPKPRVAGTRIRVQDIVIWHERSGMSVDEIVSTYPTLTKADVYAALAYYWDHREELDRQWSEAFAEQAKRTNKSPLQEKLKRLRSGAG